MTLTPVAGVGGDTSPPTQRSMAGRVPAASVSIQQSLLLGEYTHTLHSVLVEQLPQHWDCVTPARQGLLRSWQVEIRLPSCTGRRGVEGARQRGVNEGKGGLASYAKWTLHPGEIHRVCCSTATPQTRTRACSPNPYRDVRVALSIAHWRWPRGRRRPGGRVSELHVVKGGFERRMRGVCSDHSEVDAVKGAVDDHERCPVLEPHRALETPTRCQKRGDKRTAVDQRRSTSSSVHAAGTPHAQRLRVGMLLAQVALPMELTLGSTRRSVGLSACTRSAPPGNTTSLAAEATGAIVPTASSAATHIAGTQRMMPRTRVGFRVVS